MNLQHPVIPTQTQQQGSPESISDIADLNQLTKPSQTQEEQAREEDNEDVNGNDMDLDLGDSSHVEMWLQGSQAQNSNTDDCDVHKVESLMDVTDPINAMEDPLRCNPLHCQSCH